MKNKKITLGRVLRLGLKPFAVLAVAILCTQMTLPVYAATTTTKYLNGKIVFGRYIDGETDSEIYTMLPDGSSITQITDSETNEKSPSWSPDMSKILFHSDRNGSGGIYSMNADGSNETFITADSATEASPMWSPDGTKILFASSRDGNPEIYHMNTDGTGVVRLTNSASYDTYPSWSPDGTKITFTSDRNDSQLDVYTMNADGSNVTRLTTDTGSDDNSAWSPDGTKIAFLRHDGSNYDIYTMNADGSGQTRVTSSSEQEDSVTFSPDGTKLLATIYPNTNYDSSNIFVMNIDGTGRVQLTSQPVNNYDDTYGDASWRGLSYTQTTSDDGSITSTIAADKDYSSANYSVGSNETLVVNGTIGDVEVLSGGNLAGNGSAKTVDIKPGGTLSPGSSPGCMNSGNLTIAGTFAAEIGGTVACTQYDQVRVTGSVTLNNPALQTTVVSGFTPSLGNSFTIIDNDGSDAISGTFDGIPQNGTFPLNGVTYRVSYTGGTGNDVVLTVMEVAGGSDETPVALPGVPNTGYAPVSHETITNALIVAAAVFGVLVYVMARLRRANKSR